MPSRYDLTNGLLVLIAGVIVYSFAPGGPLFVAGSEHVTSHYLGGFIAIIMGVIGLSLYRNMSRVEIGVSVLSILLGFVFILDAPGYLLSSDFQPHALAMQAIGLLTVLVGLVGIGAAFLVRRTALPTPRA
jgi:hypothetical protein